MTLRSGLQPGSECFRAKRKLEYTAPLAFSIAVAASWWAARDEESTGFGSIQGAFPFRPAQQIALTLSLMTPDDLATAKVSDTWQTGGEDWPNAYRHSPMIGCVVAFWHHEWGCPAYEVYNRQCKHDTWTSMDLWTKDFLWKGYTIFELKNPLAEKEKDSKKEAVGASSMPGPQQSVHVGPVWYLASPYP